jgi:hypothetical protein
MLIASFLCINTVSSFAQQSVGIGTNSPNPRAVLQLVSPGQNQGFLLPKLTTTQITTLGGTLGPGDIGLQVYDSLLQQIRYWNGTAWLTVSTATSVGTVTSVGLSLPSIFTVSGSPVTSTGTLTGTLVTQGQNTVFAGPTTGTATPNFRALVAGDIPSLPASIITSGTLPITRGGTNGTATPTAGAIAYGTGTAYAFTASGTSGQLLQSNGAGAPTWVNPPGAGWLLSGNAGTNPLSNYIGTADAQPLRFNTNGTERMRVSAAGVVGINNTNPVAGSFNPAMRLDVTGAIRTARDGVNGEEGGEFALGEPGLAPGGGTGNWIMDAYFAGGVNKLRLFNSRTGNNHLNITDNGTPFVGIGNFGFAEAALATLDVKGNVRIVDGTQAAGRVLTSDAGGYASWQALPVSNAWSLSGNAGTVAGTNFIGTSDAVDFRIRTSNIVRLSVTSGGNIGIGTISPDMSLEIRRESPTLLDVPFGARVFSNDFNSSPDLVLFRGRGTSASPTAVSAGDEIGNIDFRGQFGTLTTNQATGAAISGRAEANWTSATETPTDLRFRTTGAVGGLQERMRITGSGNVGIGTTAPTAQLHTTGGVRFQAFTGPGVLTVDAAGNVSSVSGSTVVGSGLANRLTFWNSSSTIAAGSNLTWDNTNERLGIGLVLPTHRLHVNGNARISTVLQSSGYTAEIDNSTAGGVNGGALVLTNSGSRSVGHNGVSIQNLTTKAGGSNSTKTGLEILSTGSWGPATLNQPNRGLYVEVAGADNNYPAIFVGGNVGIGTTTPELSLDVPTSTGFGLRSPLGSWDHIFFNVEPTLANITAGGAEGGLRFRIGNSAFGSYNGQPYTTVATMLPNGNVGIGTTTPGGRLHVENSDYGSNSMILTSTPANAGATIRFTSPAVGGREYALIGSTGTGASTGAGFFGIFDNTGGAYRMVISPAGNVGVGTIAPLSRLHVEGPGNFDLAATEGDFRIGNSIHRLKIGVAYSGGGAGDVYIGAQSGTNRMFFGAGSTLAQFQTMAVTSGSVGIGTISPSARLEVANGTTSIGAGNGTIEAYHGASFGNALFATSGDNGNNTGTIYSSARLAGVQANPTGSNNYGVWGHQPGTGSGGWGVIASRGASETTPDRYVALAGPLHSGIFMGGKVGIGTASPDFELDVRSNGSIAQLYNTFNGTASDVLFLRGGSNTSPGTWFVAFRRNDNTQIGTISQSSATSVAYNTTSDVRLKNIFGETSKGINDLMKIKIYDYQYKGDQNGKIITGFVAQELNQIFPQSVTPPRAEVDDNPAENPWMVDYGSITPLLIKAIQDQQKIIEELNLRIQKLERK